MTTRIKKLLLEATAKRFWVRAQLVVGKRGVRAGHFYCELVEVDGAGRQTARIDAVIWRSAYEEIVAKLRRNGVADALCDNTEICAHCSLSYHDVHGLKLQIHDVDPTFGEAHIQRNRKAIVDRLGAEGILRTNGELPVPHPPLRVGLVTASGSAAYCDFCRTLEASPYAFAVQAVYASMQGENAEREIVAALVALCDAGVDVVCIVRGGGSQLDLAWLDCEGLARRIATSAVPVLVGIGHEIDYGVLDAVAHSSFKTPTAVAEFLVQRVRELDERLSIAVDRARDAFAGCDSGRTT